MLTGWPSDCDRHGLGLKPTRAILLCTWERHFTALSFAWWSWQPFLNLLYLYKTKKKFIYIKFQRKNNIFASSETSQGITCPVYSAIFLRRFSASQDDRYGDKINNKIRVCP